MSLFKKPKRSFRKREKSSSSEEDDAEEPHVGSSMNEMKDLQRLRKRQRGVTVEDLKTGPANQQEDRSKVDPLSRLKTGGFVDAQTLKRELAISESAEDSEQIGTSFAAATNSRDEDADMLAYVEKELKKIKGVEENEKQEVARPKNPLDELYELPEHIKNISNSKKSEDMLSNQMLSGIPEIDLGIDQKIRNIEQTEEAKQKLIDERNRKNKESGISNFVPTNMAVNFVQHNRFNIESTDAPKMKKPVEPKPVPLRVGDAEQPQTLQEQAMKKKAGGEKATDDFHFERFKKHLRKY